MYAITYYSHRGLVIKDHTKIRMHINYEEGEIILNYISTTLSYDLEDNSHH